ncbi:MULTISPECIES: GDP-mannose 4,6-dehydratase [unclassified Beijerinckia]|uniref:GDP-mannose 4,6-dehydratase n=1 Tax=unclassified Beijerinckia TaxID=2638183 RepID=UPI000897B1A2|nr:MULTISPECIES: GDP-mannose 4,6-dehydratase [unclassified Beijerinckia]MDH7794329.1 GDP-4-dehydro-6-deoxy-D-mannose reductase [Beijerinckia sp. GAS462]SEB59000.1 GDP-4-dehydro-6-deoxy-D-mannose reductase [Beijerinckia sp. 28-YEA-48]
MSADASSGGSYQRILLTGGTGFVGGWLTPRLAQQWPKAQLFLLRRSADKVERDGWTPIISDLGDRDSLDEAVAQTRPDLIIHLAAQASVGSSFEQSALTWDANLGGSINLAMASARHVPNAVFLNVSTSEVYGASFRDGPASEDTPPRPMSAYSRSKFAAEMALADILPPATKLITVRPFNHTGPGQDQRFVLPAFAAQIAAIEQGRQPPILKVGNLSAVREFLDVRDVVEAYIAILANPAAFPTGDILNISSEAPLAIEEALALLRSAAHASLQIQIDPARLRPSDIPKASGTSRRLRERTGWKPVIPLRQTLENLLASWRDTEAL